MTANDSPAGTRPLVHEMVAAQAAVHPDLVALRWPEGELTYRGLEQSVRRFARHLAGTRRAALFNDRSPELAVAVLAVLASGGAYVPLDDTYPRARLDHMLADSGADRLLCRPALAGDVTIPEGCQLEILEDILRPAAVPDEAGSSAFVAEDSLAYVSYTSGSTGWPKGVAMPHRALANLISWQVADSGSAAGWNTLQLWPLSVDVAFQEIFGTWASGGTLVLAPEAVRQDPSRLLAYTDDNHIHRVFLPFVSLYQVIEAANRANRYPSSLREVVTAGEQLQVSESVRRFFTETGATLQNQYGTTETHVVTAKTLSGDPRDWPALPSVGSAISGAVVEVVDEAMQPVPAGHDGEICIGGTAVADGYLNLPDMTRERFRDWQDRGIRAYMSGDFGRLRQDGEIEFLGRRDNQVKINGSRVELGEVEARLKAQGAVSDAIVTVHASSGGGKYLAAHCVPAAGARINGDELRQNLASTLPRHMVPDRYIVVTSFPFTPAGKADRAALAKTVDE